MRCRTARRWTTRKLAGELSAGRIGRLERHIERCDECRREDAAYAALDRALSLLPMEAALPPRLEQDTLRRIRVAGAEDDPQPARRLGRWLGFGVPALAAAAVLVLAVRVMQPPVSQPETKPPARAQGVRRATREPAAPPVPPQARRRRTADVPSEPPPELAARPDLFISLPMLRNMEKVQHYESIQTTTLDEQGDDHSNG